MKVLCSIVLLFLIGCGNHTKITYHEVSREQLTAIAQDESTLGYATWDDRKYEVLCDIYLMPQELYASQECYNSVVHHENRHCYEFQYHADDDGIRMIHEYKCDIPIL